jgi:uncharacterized protein YeeX (DUF496 family)
MDFTENGLSMASANDKKISEFFQNVKVWARENDLKRDLKFNEEDIKLNNFYEEVKKNVHNSFSLPMHLCSILQIASKVS